MDSSILRTLMIAVVVIAGGLAAYWMIQQGAQPSPPGAPPAGDLPAADGVGRRSPPTAQTLADAFAAGQADYEAHRDLLLVLATPSATLQSDFFAWGEGEQRTEMQPGAWWAPGEVWYETDEVLQAIGLDAAAFTRLKAFLADQAILAIRKIAPPFEGELWIEFLPQQGKLDPRVQRLLVWHADPDPRSEEATYRVSEDVTYPQHMRETALPVEGWFVRETVIDRPR